MQKYYHAFREFYVATTEYDRWYILFYSVIMKDKTLETLVKAYNKYPPISLGSVKPDWRRARLVLNELGIKEPRDPGVIGLIHIENASKKLPPIEFEPKYFEIEHLPDSPPPPSIDDLMDITSELKKVTTERIRQIDVFLLSLRFQIENPEIRLKYTALTWLIKSMQYFV